MTTSSQLPALKSWLPVISLAFAAFIFNTTEFVPVGLLTSIAPSFSMDVAHTGLLITGYAWVVALLSLPLTILTARFERRRLLMFLFCVFVLSHILAGVAWSFGTLMAARMGIACAHAIFWSITIALAVRVAPKGQGAKALGMMVAGSSMATVLGVPIGTVIGQHLGWRVTFLCIGAVALAVMVVLWRLLPLLPSSNAGSLKSLPSLFRRRALLHVYALIAIIVTGHFAAYTYFGPFMENVAGFSKDDVVLLLLVVGGAGLIGSYFFSRYSSRYPIGMLMVPMGIMFGCLALLLLCAGSMYSTAALCLFWGTTMVMIALTLQTKVLAIASDATDVAIAMFSGIFNIGIGGGALIGGQVSLHLGTAYVGYVGAVILMAALALCYFFSRHLLSAHRPPGDSSN